MALGWDTLEGIASEPHFSAAVGRFVQQSVDAVSFSTAIRPKHHWYIKTFPLNYDHTARDFSQTASLTTLVQSAVQT
eukprot:COSAG02_NODE_13_length_57813_cov_14.298276_1_plen_77_part_00